MPSNLLLLPLLSGFLFLHFTHLLRFRAQRLDGYRLLIESAGYGVVFAVLGRVIVVLAGSLPGGRWFGDGWARFSPFPHSDSAAWALLLGPLSAMLINLRIPLNEARRRVFAKPQSATDGLARFLNNAEANRQLISVSLRNRKWYVGYVKEAPNLSPDQKYFRILPIISGYRHRDTLETIRTVFYEEVVKNRNADEFVKTLRIDDVEIANLFDPNLYEDRFAEPSHGEVPAAPV